MLRHTILGILLFACTLHAGETVRVMSFNIRHGKGKDGDNVWEKRKELCVSRITVFKPDLLGLQEALGFQNEFIAKTLTGYKQLGVGRDDGKDAGEFSTIFYKAEHFEALDSGTFWLSETPEKIGSKSWDSSLPRIATWAKLKDKANGKELVFINTHFDHIGKVARLEAAKLMRKFATEKGKDLPVVITGDFNTGPGSEPYKALNDKLDGAVELHDTYAEFFREKPEPSQGSFHGFKPEPGSTRIDWVLRSTHFTTKDAAIDRHREGNLYPSDHYPVWAVLEWK